MEKSINMSTRIVLKEDFTFQDFKDQSLNFLSSKSNGQVPIQDGDIFKIQKFRFVFQNSNDDIWLSPWSL